MKIPRIMIIGGGIAGLATAHRLSELSRECGTDCDITLLEAQEDFGGLIDTHTDHGLILEGGPDAFLTVEPWVIDLCHRLGLSDELIETNLQDRSSSILYRGQLVPVPEGFHLIAPVRAGVMLRTPLLSWWGKLRVACEPLIPVRDAAHDESAAEFIRRRLGREVYERLAQPMLTGIYSADPERLSAAAVL